jgi:hypothetical protein
MHDGHGGSFSGELLDEVRIVNGDMKVEIMNGHRLLSWMCTQ